MAPRRVNAKLLIILGVCLVVVGVAAGATWFLVRSNVSATLAEAKAAELAGDPERAIEFYGKVVKHPRFSGDTELIMRIANLHGDMSVDSSRLAQYHLQYWLAWLRQAWRMNPSEKDAFQQEMEILMRLGLEVRRPASWDEMFARTDEVLEQYPHMTLALKYRGISQVNRMMMAASNLTAEERSQALADLRFSLREQPEDRQTILYLAHWHVMEAVQQDRAQVDVFQVEKLRKESARLTGEAVQRHPDEVQRRIDHVSILMTLDRHEETVPHIDMLYRQLLHSPAKPIVTTNVVQLLLKQHALAEGGRRDGLSRAVLEKTVALVQAARNAHPHSPLLMVVMARLRQQEGETLQAITQYEYAWKGARSDRPLEFIIQFNVRVRGKLDSLSLQLDEAKKLRPGPALDAKLDKIEAELEVVKAEIGDVPGVRRLAGGISLLRGDMADAANQLDQYAVRAGPRDVKTLLQQAQALQATGQWGAAAEIYARILELRPDLSKVRVELARVYLGGQMLEEAKSQIKRLASALGQDDQMVQALELERNVRRQAWDEVRAGIRKIVLPDAAAGVRLAQLCRQAGMTTEFHTLAAKAHRLDPTHKAALASVVLSVPDDRAKQLEYVEKSRIAGMDEVVLGGLVQILKGDLDVVAATDKQEQDAITEEADPAARAAQWYRYHAARGNLEGARAALQAVQDRSSLEPSYLLASFDDALLRGDWERSETLAARARRARDGSGADYAEGRFYLGRLSMARRRYDQAATDFRAALEKRRTYSEGWVWLAEALLGMRDLASAQDAFRTAVEQKPDSVPALMGLGRVSAERGQNDEALKLFRRAYEFNPDNFVITDVYLRFEAEHGDLATALVVREAIAEKDPKNVANRKALALILARQGHHEKAMAHVRLMTRYGSELRETAIAEARVLAAGGQRELATRRLIEFARTSTGSSGEDHLAAARELARMGLEGNAISGYRRAVERGGEGQVAAMRELAELLLRTRDGLPEAQKLYRQLWNMDRFDLHVGCAYARLLVLSGEYERADEVKDTLLESHGRNVETLVLAAQVAAGKKSQAVAEANLDAAIKLAPQRADLYLGKAQLLRVDATRHGDALSLLDNALELNPLLADAQALKAEIYDGRNEINMALREYETLLRLEPDHAGRLRLADLYREHGHAPQLKRLLDESAQRYPDSAEWRRQQALFAQRQNNARLALRYMKEAFNLRKSGPVLRELVTLMIQLEQAEDAKKILRANTVLLRKDPVLQAQRARAVHMLGEDRTGAQFFRTALTMAADPKQFSDRNVFEETVAQVDAALGLEGTLELVNDLFGAGVPIWVGLGLASLEASAADYDAVVERLTRLEYKVYRLAPVDQASFYRMYGEALSQVGQRDRAAAAFDHLVRIDPEDAESRHRLAMILADSDKPEDQAAAVERARQALALRPSEAHYMETLGWCLFRAGDEEEGRAGIQASLRQSPTPLAYLHMAEVELGSSGGSRDHAITMLWSARRLAEQVADSQVLVAASRHLAELDIRDASDDGMDDRFTGMSAEARPKTLRDMATRLVQGGTFSVAILDDARDRWQGGRRDLETGFLYAGELILSERHTEAESILGQLKADHADTAYTYILSSLIHAANGATAQAQLDIDASLRLSPRWAALHLAKARLTAKDASGYEEALLHLDTALSLDPSLGGAQQLKGDIYWMRGETNFAIKEYETLLRLAPKARRRLALAKLYFAAGRRVSLKTLLDESESLSPRSSVWPHQQALLALYERDGALALRKMRMAFTRGKTAALLKELVALQLAAGRAGEALTTLRTNSDLTMQAPIYQAMQGRALAMQGLDEQAASQFSVALQQAQGLDMFVAVAEQIRLGAGNDVAMETTRVAYGKAPPDWVLLGIATVQVSGEAYEEALAGLEALAGKVQAMSAPDQACYYRALATALHHLSGRTTEAEAAYGRWRILKPAETDAVTGLGRLLADDLKRPSEAVKLLKAARAAKPNDLQILDVLGLALWRNNDRPAAKEMLEKRLQLVPGATANLYLAEIALEEGRRARAIELLNSAKDIAEQIQKPRLLKAVNGHLAALESRREATP